MRPVYCRREIQVAGGAALELIRLTPGHYRPGLPPIIMLHEGLGSVAMWKSFPRRLAAVTGAEVLAYSRAGHGRSAPATLPRTAAYLHDEGLRVLPELIDSLKLRRPILFGHSDGASIALICAGGTNTAISALVLLAPHLFVEEVALVSIAATRTAWSDSDLPQRLARYHDNAETTFFGWNDIWLHPEFRRWDIRRYLATIDLPVLAIQGEDDEYGSMRQIDGIAEQLPRTRLLKLADCRHSPHRDRPQAVLEAVSQFIDAEVGYRPGEFRPGDDARDPVDFFGGAVAERITRISAHPGPAESG